MLLFDAPLTFREFMTHEDLPLATIFRDVLGFLRGRSDGVLFGAQAINAWCETPRMTSDVDVLSTRAAALAEELRAHLAAKFGIAASVREVVPGGFRVYQLRKPKNRHLVDVRQVEISPASRDVDGVAVAEPFELAAMKVLAIQKRGGREKGLSDRLDLHRLLNAHEDLRDIDGPVAARLRTLGADDPTLQLWFRLASERVEPDEDDGY